MTINVSSLRSCIGNGDKVLVYGYMDAHLGGIQAAINVLGGIDARLTSAGRQDSFAPRLGGDMNGGLSNMAAGKKAFKDELVDMVFLNYQNKREGFPLIPVLFCVDKQSDAGFYYDPSGIASKKIIASITDAEIRRAYKLCCEFPNARLKKVANETFRFAKVSLDRATGVYSLKKINAPWAQSGWDRAWQGRPRSMDTANSGQWRGALTQAIAEYDQEHPAKSCCVIS